MTANNSAFPAETIRRPGHVGKAYWAMVRRVTLIAGAIDIGYLALFAWLGSTPMALINIAGIAMYAAAYLLIGRRRNVAGLVLIWAEVVLHSAIGSLLIGWDSGFHYYLLLFIPAIVIANTRGYAAPIVLALLAYYLGLNAACDHFGALAPLDPKSVKLLFWVHVCIVFAMFASLSSFYRRSIALAEQKLVRQASSDPLTGLYNRAHFHVLALGAMARRRRSGKPVALLLCDIDHFKRVNDRLGHAAGDQVLIHVATLLKDSLREGDSLARWGGEEFLALMPDCPREMAGLVAERLRAAVEGSPVLLAGDSVAVTLSMGIAEVDHADDLDAAIARADEALYRSKGAGRNQVSHAGLAPQRTLSAAGQ